MTWCQNSCHQHGFLARSTELCPQSCGKFSKRRPSLFYRCRALFRQATTTNTSAICYGSWSQSRQI